MNKSRRVTINGKVYRIALMKGNQHFIRNECRLCDMNSKCMVWSPGKSNIAICYQIHLKYAISTTSYYLKRDKNKDGTKTIYNLDYNE